jgi:hypothetical protein
MAPWAIKMRNIERKPFLISKIGFRLAFEALRHAELKGVRYIYKKKEREREHAPLFC